MDRNQAIRIQKPLLDAASALDRARMAVAGLGKEERIRFDGMLIRIATALHAKLLPEIHDQYPDLEPPYDEPEPPHIISRLRWAQVRLPPSITEADIDAIILSVVTAQWRKVASVVTRAARRCEELALPIIEEEVFAARIPVLVKAGHLEDIGDLRKWRHSEVRLKP